MVTKKRQEIYSNLFALSQKFSDFALRAFSALRFFATLLSLDFPKLLDALGKKY